MPDKPQEQLMRAEQRKAWWILAISTFAFVVCFAAWMMNGVLITFLVENGLYAWTPSEHIPDYFPADVGVVGGIVGVLGGLGGFSAPSCSDISCRRRGLWTSCWMFFAILVAICLVWMHLVIQKMMRSEAPKLHRRIE